MHQIVILNALPSCSRSKNIQGEFSLTWHQHHITQPIFGAETFIFNSELLTKHWALQFARKTNSQFYRRRQTEAISLIVKQEFDMVDMGPSPVPSFCCSTSCALRDHPPRAISLDKNDSDSWISTMLLLPVRLLKPPKPTATFGLGPKIIKQNFAFRTLGEQRSSGSWTANNYSCSIL